jgi:hypothetical protein
VLKVGRVHEVVFTIGQCVSAIRGMEVLVFFYITGSCSHVTEVGGPLVL